MRHCGCEAVSLRSFAWRALVSVDYFFNWYKGDPSESISVTMGRLKARENDPFAKAVCWALDKLDKNHCEDEFNAAAHPSPKEATDKILGDAR